MTDAAKIALAWLRSWRKPVGAWSPDDYPIVVGPNGTQRMEGFPAYKAYVLRWTGIVGLGESPEEARADLLRNLDCVTDRPRPGTKVPLTFAGSAQLDGYGDWVYDVVEKVTGVQAFFLSDGSSLSDFGEPGPFLERVRELYGVDVSDVENGDLATILGRLAAAGKGPENP